MRSWRCKSCGWESTSSPHVRARHCIACKTFCVRTDGGTLDVTASRRALYWDLHEREEQVAAVVFQETTVPVTADEAAAVFVLERDLRRGVMPAGKA